MPKTAEQVEGGGSKVAATLAERALDAYLAADTSGPGSARKHGLERMTAAIQEVISAFLSDKAIEGYARETWGWDGSRPLTDDEKAAARAALQAAVDHLGGTDAH